MQQVRKKLLEDGTGGWREGVQQKLTVMLGGVNLWSVWSYCVKPERVFRTMPDWTRIYMCMRTCTKTGLTDLEMGGEKGKSDSFADFLHAIWYIGGEQWKKRTVAQRYHMFRKNPTLNFLEDRTDRESNDNNSKRRKKGQKHSQF